MTPLIFRVSCRWVGVIAAFAVAARSSVVDAGSPDAGAVHISFSVCDASACGGDFLSNRGVIEVSPTLGMKPHGIAPDGVAPEQVSEGMAIYVRVKQSKFIRFPCRVQRVVLGNTPWDFTSTAVAGEGLLTGMFEGHAPMRVWCNQKVLSFEVYVTGSDPDGGTSSVRRKRGQ